ncbi:MAG TPA: non-heme iron oxygenase ferredoxin subunit [Chloroflexota bacterium]|nr:non-heme iron oxygenase ferredoxin subunit [Chloroflexota bacterium]
MPEGFEVVARVDELQDGDMRQVTAGGEDVVLARAGGEFYAVSGVCTHAEGYLDEGTVSGCEIVCPLHSGKFDLRTGAATWGPPVDPLTTYQVLVEGEDVLVGPPKA